MLAPSTAPIYAGRQNWQPRFTWESVNEMAWCFLVLQGISIKCAAKLPGSCFRKTCSGTLVRATSRTLVPESRAGEVFPETSSVQIARRSRPERQVMHFLSRFWREAKQSIQQTGLKNCVQNVLRNYRVFGPLPLGVYFSDIVIYIT